MMAYTSSADSESVDTELLPNGQELRRAKAMIKERSKERYQAEKTAYKRLIAEREIKKRTSKKTQGHKPTPPEPGPTGNFR